MVTFGLVTLEFKTYAYVWPALIISPRLVQLCLLGDGVVRHSGDLQLCTFQKYLLGVILRCRAGYTLGFATQYSLSYFTHNR